MGTTRRLPSQHQNALTRSYGPRTTDYGLMSSHDAIIIGGGPAGSAAAISLAQQGARVLLLEEKRMPREKLCGEFITAECFPSLGRLGVMERMVVAGARRVSRVSLVAPNGRTVQTQVSNMSD